MTLRPAPASYCNDLVEVLRSHAANRPDKTLYRFLAARDDEEEETMSFAELHRAAEDIAGHLLARTGCSGGVALLLYPPGLEFVRAFFGCLYAGVVAVPVYLPNARKDSWNRLEAVARDAGAAFVLINEGDRDGVARWLQECPNLGLTPLVTPSLRYVGPTAPVPIGPETLAFLQYTSGSTGDPKGVMVSHANLIHNQRLIQRKFEHDDSAVIVGWLPQYHDMGLIGNILQPLFLGATAILIAPASFLQNPLRWLQTIARYRATTSGGPDFAYRLCAERIGEEHKADLDLSGWEVAFNGAEPISAATLEKFHQAFRRCGFRKQAFFPCYGLAEGTLFAAGSVRQRGPVTLRVERAALERDLARPLSSALADVEAEQADSVELVSSGELADEDELKIVDPATSERCAPGMVGEIWLHGPSVAGGYWRRNELSRECFQARLVGDARPHLRTGDLGFVLDGQLYVTGRLKDLIIIRGRNFYPQDIEAAVQHAFPELRADCGACFAIERDGEEILAMVLEVERTALRRADFAALWRGVSQLVSERFGIRLHTLALVKPTMVPKTTSGKIRRKACRAMLEHGPLEALARFDADREQTAATASAVSDMTVAAAQASPALRLLADVLRLPVTALHPDDALGVYGLDSIQAADIEHRLDAQCGVSLDMSQLLDGMTVGEFLAETESTPAAPEDAPAMPEAVSAAPSVGPQQRAIWQIQTLHPDGRAYNISVPLQLGARLDPDTLERALSRLLQRHPQLSTVYHEVGGALTASARPATAAPITLIEAPWDASLIDEALRAQASQAIALDESVFHAYLLQTGPDRSLLHLVVHHIAVDAWSVQLLARDLARAYLDLVHDRPTIAPPAHAYTDFIAAQQRWLHSTEGVAAITEARASIGAHSGILNLPTDRARPKRFGFVGGDVALRLDDALSAAVRAKAGEWNTTLFTALLAAWQALMHRLTGQTDFIVGAPVSQRPTVAFGDVVGCFVDLKPMTCSIDPPSPFRDFVAQTRADVLRALRLKRVPAQLILRDGPAHSVWPSTVQPNVRFALLQAQVLPDAAPFLLNLEGAHIDLDGLSFESRKLDLDCAPADLALTVLEHDGGLHARFSYNREIYDRVRIERIAAMYRELLRGIVANDRMPISALPLVDREERDRLLAQSAPALADYGDEICVHRLIERQAAIRGDALAVLCEDETLTYAELDRRASRLARKLRARGVVSEDRVGLYLRRSADMVVAFLAALKAGVCSVMLEPSLPPERCRYIVENSRMTLLLTNLDGFGGFDPGEVAVLDLREPDESDDHDGSEFDLALTPQNAAYVIYTSGSTGQPKGVVGLHAGIVNRTRWMIEHFGLSAGDRVLHTTQMGFVRAEREILFPLAAGATLVILPQSGLNRPHAVLDALEQHAIGYTASSPSLIRMILDHDRERFARLRSLRHWFIGADALRPDLIARLQDTLPSLRLTYFYGSTEVSSDVAYFDVPPAYATDAPTTPIGRALPNTGLYLLDTAMEPVADGMPGEIYVAGVQLARGYLGQPALTAEKFVADPFSDDPGARLYRTGDLAYRRDDGDLVVVGRNDDQINLYGHRIELGEIEHAIRAQPQVEDVVALPRQQGEHTLIVAYVACADADAVARLSERLVTRLPAYMIPGLFVRLDKLPVTTLGKIDRAALRAIDLSQAQAADHVPAETPLQARMADLLADLLGLPASLISMRRNFFELGANSAVLSEFALRLNRMQLPRPVRIADVFHHHTLRDLAAALESSETPDTAATAQRSVDRAQARRQAMGRCTPARRPA